MQYNDQTSTPTHTTVDDIHDSYPNTWYLPTTPTLPRTRPKHTHPPQHSTPQLPRPFQHRRQSHHAVTTADARRRRPRRHAQRRTMNCNTASTRSRQAASTVKEQLLVDDGFESKQDNLSSLCRTRSVRWISVRRRCWQVVWRAWIRCMRSKSWIWIRVVWFKELEFRR